MKIELSYIWKMNLQTKRDENKMQFTPEQIERLRKLGKIPDRYYFQMNGDPAQANYQAQKETLAKRKAPLFEIDESKLHDMIQDTIQDLIQDLNID